MPDDGGCVRGAKKNKSEQASCLPTVLDRTDLTPRNKYVYVYVMSAMSSESGKEELRSCGDNGSFGLTTLTKLSTPWFWGGYRARESERDREKDRRGREREARFHACFSCFCLCFSALLSALFELHHRSP